MKVYYVYHSCFLIETSSSFIIFDYFKHKKSKYDDFNFEDLFSKALNSQKLIYIFSSHNHHDHFNDEILTFSKSSNTYLILSDDIKINSDIPNITFVKENKKYILNNITINTFGSTDEGVSFLVNIDNLNIFHAGDLNWWKWSDDTIEEAISMENNFKSIIENICNLNCEIDISFFPVDGRLEKDHYYYGGKYFLESLNPKIFIPMHLWDNYKICTDFKNLMTNSLANTEILTLSHANQILIGV